MPDGDRFEWKLKGKGWRKFYRLLASEAAPHLLAEHALKSTAAYIRRNPAKFGEYVNAVRDALDRQCLLPLPPESELPGSAALSARLDKLVRSHGYSEASQLAQRSAWKAFLNLHSEAGAITPELVAGCFGGELSWEITERQCIGIVRDRIASKTNRSVEDQLQAEHILREEVTRLGENLGKQLCTEDVSNIRAPKSQRKQFTEEDLHRPLPILDVP